MKAVAIIGAIIGIIFCLMSPNERNVLIWLGVGLLFWAVVIGIPVLIWKSKKYFAKKEEEEQKKEMQKKWAEEAEIRQKDEKIRREEAERRKQLEEAAKHKRYLEAKFSGVDVCDDCRTIRPNRCADSGCRKCLNCERRNNSTYCYKCQEKRDIKACHEAEARGEDVCWECLTANPSRCCHGTCSNHYCGSCDDD